MKILIVAKPQADNFIRNYYMHMDCDVLITRDAADVWGCAKNYDVVIHEWANDLAARITEKKLPCELVIRIHDHEVRQGRIHNVNWKNVDKVWFINKDIQREFAMEYDSNDFFLPNAISDFDLEERQSTEKKVGLLTIYSRPRKRIDRAIDVISRVNESDPDWQLVIRCEPWPNWDELKAYAKKKKANVVFEQRNIDLDTYGSERSDVNEFFKDKSVVISTSDHEGFHYAIGEGMLCGCKPVVWNWEFGSPRTFWSPYVHDSIENMANAILSYKPSGEYRKFVMDNFHPDVLIPELIKNIDNEVV